MRAPIKIIVPAEMRHSPALKARLADKNRPRRPKVVLSTGVNGNIYNVLALCARALRRNKHPVAEIAEMARRVSNSATYDDAIQILMEYCDVD